MLASYQLIVPNTVASPALVRDFVHRLAQSAGQDDVAAASMADAAAAASDYVIRFSYPENRFDELHAFCDVTPDSLNFRLTDRGLPRIPLEGAVPDEEGDAVQRLRAALADMQEVRWELRGYHGKELRFGRRLGKEPPGELLSRADTLRHPTRAAPAAEQEYSVRRFQPSDAAGIAELVYRVYGMTYDDEDYYYPQRIVAENASGAMLSVLAVHPSGEIVGHYALEQRDMPGIFEGSSAVVNPLHRGMHLMEKMRATAIEEGRAEGLKGLIFLPWCVHVYSQKANERFGAFVMSVNLNDSAPVAIEGFEAESLGQRVSTMLYYTPLQPRAPRPARVPAHLREMVSLLLEPMDGSVHFEDAGGEPGEGVLRVKELPHDALAEITVEGIDAHSGRELESGVQHLLVRSRAATIFLNVPMADPGCPALVAAAEALGFGFVGVGPDYTARGDALRFALLDEVPDPAHIHVYSERGQRLLAFALAEQARVRR